VFDNEKYDVTIFCFAQRQNHVVLFFFVSRLNQMLYALSISYNSNIEAVLFA